MGSEPQITLEGISMNKFIKDEINLFSTNMTDVLGIIRIAQNHEKERILKIIEEDGIKFKKIVDTIPMDKRKLPSDIENQYMRLRATLVTLEKTRDAILNKDVQK